MIKYLVDRVYRPGSEEDFIYVEDPILGYASNFHVNRSCIEAAEDLVKDCDSLYANLQLAQKEQSFVFFKKIRQQRRDHQLFSQYESVLPKIKTSEKSLRALIGTIVDRKNLLRTQCSYLQIRVDSCKNYNENKLDEVTIPVVEARRLLSVLLDEVSSYRSMSAFNDEVLLSKYQHEQSLQFSPPIGHTQGQLARLAAMKANLGVFRPSSAREKAPSFDQDEDKIVLQDKIDRLNELKLKSMNCLSAILQQREINLSTKENCEYCLKKLMPIAKKDRNHSLENDLGPELDTFHHGNCVNCDYACKLAFISVNAFGDLSDTGTAANGLLQKLVEIREGIMDLAIKVDFASSTTVI